MQHTTTITKNINKITSNISIFILKIFGNLFLQMRLYHLKHNVKFKENLYINL